MQLSSTRHFLRATFSCLLIALALNGAALAGLQNASGFPEYTYNQNDELDRATFAAGPGSHPIAGGATVDLYSGNLHLSMPLSSAIPVEGFTLGIGASYNSNRAYVRDVAGTDYLQGRSWLGLGWSMHLGRMLPGAFFEDPSGALERTQPSNFNATANYEVLYYPPKHDIGTCGEPETCVWSGDGTRGDSPCCMGRDPSLNCDGFDINNTPPHPDPDCWYQGWPTNPLVAPDNCSECACYAECNNTFGVKEDDEHYIILHPNGMEYRLDYIDVDDPVAGGAADYGRKGFYTTSIKDRRYGHELVVEYYESLNPRYPEAIKRVYSESNTSLEITTDVCVAADVPARCPEEGLLKSVTSIGFQGADVVYELYYTTVSVTDSSGVQTVPVLSEVRLPEPASGAGSVGSAFFSYETALSGVSGTSADWGPLLTQYELPLGAILEFEYGTWNSGTRVSPPPGSTTSHEQHVGVAKAQVFPDGISGSASTSSRYTWQWSREFDLEVSGVADCSGTEADRKSTFSVIYPDGRKASTQFEGHPCYDVTKDWGVIGTPNRTVTFETDNVTPLRTTTFDWDYEVETETEDNVRALMQQVVVTFEDDDGSCYGGSSTGNAFTTTVTNSSRNEWGQWEESKLESDYLDAAHRTTRINYYTDDDPDPDWSSCPNVYGYGTFGHQSVQHGAGPESAYFTLYDFTCNGEIEKVTTPRKWQSAGTGTVPALTGDFVVETDYDSTTGYSSEGRITAFNATQTLTTEYDWDTGLPKAIRSADVSPPYDLQNVTYDSSGSGLATAQKDANGIEYGFSYDALGRTTQVSPPQSSSENATRFIYASLSETRVIQSSGTEATHDSALDDQLYSSTMVDGLGRTVEQFSALPEESVAPSVGRLSYQIVRYDALGRVVFASLPMTKEEYDNASSTHITWTGTGSLAGYDLSGIPTKNSRPYGTITFYGEPSNPGTTTNPLDIVPDPLGRVRRVEAADGSVVRYDYCGPHVQTTVEGIRTGTGSNDVADSVTTNYFDAIGNLVLVDAPTGSADAEYRYDPRDKLVKVNLLEQLPLQPFANWKANTIVDGQVRTYDYDAAGMLRSSDAPESGRTEIGFHSAGVVTHDRDVAGNVLTWRDELARARGYFFRNVYDDVGRLKRTERVRGTPPVPEETDIDRLAGHGDFEETSDIGTGAWDTGEILSGSFVSGSSDWQATDYSSLNCIPSFSGSDSGLYLGSNCSYQSVDATPQAARHSITSITRDDVVTFRFWRSVREDTGTLDALSVFVVEDTGGGSNSIASSRYLFRMDESQNSYAQWRQTHAMRIGDLYDTSEWAEGATKDFWVYVVFEKGDSETALLGSGVAVDDIFVGRYGVETLSEHYYDTDNCLADVNACSTGPLATNAYLGQLSKVVSFQSNRSVAENLFFYKGMNGRLSAERTNIDWMGSGAFDEFLTRYSYGPSGEVTSYVAPHQDGINEHARTYIRSFKKGFLDGIQDLNGAVFVEPDLSPPAVRYDGAGNLLEFAYNNGTKDTVQRDDFGRALSFTALGPDPDGPGTIANWSSGNYDYDGAGNIWGIGNQTFTYDLSGRLVQSVLQRQASDPASSTNYTVGYTYDAVGNTTDRSWNSSGGGSAPLGFGFSYDFGADLTDNKNQVTDDPFRYDLNGNMTRLSSSSAPISATWSPRNRVAAFTLGNPDSGTAPAEEYVYDYRGRRIVRLPIAGDFGRPSISIRNGTGQVLSEFTEVPGVGRPELRKDFVYSNSRLIVERTVSETPPTLTTHTTLQSNGEYGFAVAGGSASSYQVDIRTDGGHQRSVTGVVPDSAGIFWVDETLFAADEPNYVRIRGENGPVTRFSAATTLTIDSTVTPSSANQVHITSVSRSGNDVILRFKQLTSNGQSTNVEFTPLGSSSSILLTPTGLPAGVTSLTVTSQALSNPCGTLGTSQSGLDTAGASVPRPDPPQDLSQTYGDSCPVPAPPITEYSFADQYHQRDHLGSLRVATNEGGWKTSARDFYPNGKELGDPDSEGESRWKYTQHERDLITAADYMLARYKSADGNCFMSVDPLDPGSVLNPQSWNRFAYVQGNPINYTDPTGLYTQAPSPFDDNSEDDWVGGGFDPWSTVSRGFQRPMHVGWGNNGQIIRKPGVTVFGKDPGPIPLEGWVQALLGSTLIAYVLSGGAAAVAAPGPRAPAESAESPAPRDPCDPATAAAEHARLKDAVNRHLDGTLGRPKWWAIRPRRGCGVLATIVSKAISDFNPQCWDWQIMETVPRIPWPGGGVSAHAATAVFPTGASYPTELWDAWQFFGGDLSIYPIERSWWLDLPLARGYHWAAIDGYPRQTGTRQQCPQ